MSTENTETKAVSSQEIANPEAESSKGKETQLSQAETQEKHPYSTEELDYLGQLYANKMHSKLNIQTNEYKSRAESAEQRIGQIEAEREATATQQLQAKEKAELEAAEDDSGLQTTIRQRYADIRKHDDLVAENKRLEAETADKKQLLDALNKSDKEKLAGELAKEFPNVSADVMLGFKADTPEEMRAVAERLSKIAPVAGPKLPPPGTLPTTPSGTLEGKTPMELAVAAYSNPKRK